MKKERILAITVTAILLWCVVWVWAGDVNSGQRRNDGLMLQGSVNKESYILGEPVRIQFKFVNNGETMAIVPSDGVEVGSLKIFIADKENGEYKEYFGSGWGRKRGRRLNLEPGGTHEYSEATILRNGKPRVSHLNENVAREVLKGRISTEYVFPEPGVYWIKGLSYMGENFMPIESKPIRIEVKEPEGDDLEVWNQIKGNKEIAYLLQIGSFDAGEEVKKEQLVSQVEQIYTQFPNSVYSSYLKSNLEKYKADEARRKEAYKNMKVGQKPE